MGRNKKPLGSRGLVPLVARPEPYRPRYRAGVGTLAAKPGCRARHRASTLCASLDMCGYKLTNHTPTVNV